MRVTFKPPAEQRPVVLTSRSGVSEWIEQEIAFWRPLASALGTAPKGVNWGQVEQPLKDALTLDPDGDSYASEAEQRLQSAVDILQFTSRDPRAALLQTMLAGGEDSAVIGFTYHALIDAKRVANLASNQRYSALVSQALAVRAAWLAFPTKRAVPEMKKSLQRIYSEAGGVLTGLQDEHGHASAAVASFEAQAQQLLTEGRDSWTNLLKKVDDEYAHLKERLTVELSLRAPVEYWSEKSSRHRSHARTYRWWFTGIAVAGLAVAIVTLWAWLVPTLEGDPTSWWALVLFSVFVAFWAWPLRLTSKLYLSHMHLAEDAGEREVVTKTFLALGDVIELTGDDRHLLLAALFRSSGAGLVKDDSNLSITDLLVARMAGKD
jgi:hypothetical protein